MYDAVVVGGGIAGMTAALMLKHNGMNVRVLEAQDRPGGNIKTLVENGIHMETGPHSFMGSSEYIWKLVEKLQMGDAVEPAAPASKNRYIYRRGKLNPLPMGLLSFIGTPLLSPAAKLRLMMEPLVPNGAKEEDTAWEFFRRRFGKEAATYIMTPFISGVYAGDVKMLGARAAFAKFWKFEKDAGSMILGAFKYMKNKRKRLRAEGLPIRRGLYSFHGGLGTITVKLAEALSEEIETGQTIKKVVKGKDGYIIENSGKQWKARYVVIAAPPPVTGSILNQSLPEVEDTFAGIPMSPVSLVHWTAPENGTPFPDGFGFLMPRLFDLRVLGTLFPSKLFKERVPTGRQLFATFYGGMTDPEAMGLDDDHLESLLLEEHRRIFHRSLEDAKILKILRYPGAIPQLLPDHPEKMEGIQTAISRKMPGVVLAGNYLTGVGIEHAVESGFRAAERIRGTES